MYEYARGIRRRRLYGLGTDDQVTPGQQLVLDYRAGRRTRAEVHDACMRVSPADRYHTSYSECRWFLTPEELCRRENNNIECARAQIEQQCFFTPPDLRHDRCFFYMEMDAEDAEASNAGPIVEQPPLVEATQTIPQFRQRVAQAAQAVVNVVRGTEAAKSVASADVRTLQRAVLAAGCTLPRFGADGQWGSETEQGVRCLAGRQGWSSVFQSFPWVSAWFTSTGAPATQVASASDKPSGAMSTQAAPSAQTASIFPSFNIFPGLPSWVPWVAAGAGLVLIIVLGSYITSKRGEAHGV